MNNKSNQEDIEKLLQKQSIFIQNNPNNTSDPTITTTTKNENEKNSTNFFFNNLPESTDEIEEIPNYNPINTLSNKNLNYVNNAKNFNKNLSPISEEIIEFEKIAAAEAHKAKKHEYYPFMHFLAFLLSLAMLYFSVIFQSDFDKAEFSYFTSIGENWKLSPLKDVYLGSGKCEKANDNVINDAWPGLQQGCECGKEIFKGECPQKRLDCVPLKSYEAKNYAFWQGANLCANKKIYVNADNNKSNKSNNKRKIKTENNINNTNTKNINNSLVKNNEKNEIYPSYFDLEISEKTFSSLDHCPENLKNCGVIDTYGNYLCLPFGEACPINNINVRNFLQNKNFYLNGLNNLKTNEVKTNTKLISALQQEKILEKTLTLKNSEFNFSNIFNPLESKIPVQFKLDFDQPCKNPFYKNTNFYVFYLDPFFGKQKCFQYSDDINPKINLFTFNNNQYFNSKKIYLDMGFTLIDKYSYRNLLIDNQIYQQFTRIPVSFNDQLNQDVGLYSKSYFGINAKCHKEIKEKKFVPKIFSAFENLKHVDTIVSCVSGIIGLSALNIALVMFFFIASLDLSSVKLAEINKANYLSVKFFVAFLFFIILSLIAVFILSVANTARLFAIGNLNVIFADPQCVDSFSFDIYYKYFSVVERGKVLMLISLCFSFALFVAYVFYVMGFVKSHVIGTSNNEENEEIHEIEEEEKKLNADLSPMGHRTYITLNNE